MPEQRTPQPPFIQFFDLLLMELSNWRWSWRGMVTTGMIAPMFSIMALGVFARDLGPAALAYVLTGNVVLALMFENMSKMTSRFSFMRVSGALDYYAMLPIQRNLLVLASIFSFFVLSLPAVVFTVVFGAWFLEIGVHPHPAIMLIVPLATLPLSGIGALLGVRTRSVEEALAISRVLVFVLLALGPVVIPSERLPASMVWLGKLSPATYAASALRQVLLGPITGQLPIDLLALIGFSVIAFIWAGRAMQWRQG
jgi:ABC-2 type transport system permease protein